MAPIKRNAACVPVYACTMPFVRGDASRGAGGTVGSGPPPPPNLDDDGMCAANNDAISAHFRAPLKSPPQDAQKRNSSAFALPQAGQ
jgi:hypothetical protein